MLSVINDGEILLNSVENLYAANEVGSPYQNIDSERGFSEVGQNVASDSSVDIVVGFTQNEYSWLFNEFNLTKDDVEAVTKMTKEEFDFLVENLAKAKIAPEKKYTTDDLVSVLKSARQLVPSELEAAAYGAANLGLHLGGRALVAVDPLVNVV